MEQFCQLHDLKKKYRQDQIVIQQLEIELLAKMEKNVHYKVNDNVYFTKWSNSRRAITPLHIERAVFEFIQIPRENQLKEQFSCDLSRHIWATRPQKCFTQMRLIEKKRKNQAYM